MPADVVVIGDGEFHFVKMLRAIDHAGWSYCIRIHAETYVRREAGQDPGQTWQETRDLDSPEGESRYWSEVSVAKARDFGLVGLVYFWAESEEAPRRLVTQLEAGLLSRPSLPEAHVDRGTVRRLAGRPVPPASNRAVRAGAPVSPRSEPESGVRMGSWPWLATSWDEAGAAASTEPTGATAATSPSVCDGSGDVC